MALQSVPHHLDNESTRLPQGEPTIDFGRGEVACSANLRLERTLGHLPGWINREACLPCHATELFLDEELRDTAGEAVLQQHLVTVIPPEALKALPEPHRERVRVLASSKEWGRALEIDTPLEIGGIPSVISVKSAGATAYARANRGHASPQCHTHPFVQETFEPQIGMFEHDSAIAEKEASEALRKRGLDTERILAIYRIEEFADSTGELKPLSFYTDQRIIPEGSEPVLMFRATRTAFRMLDPIQLAREDRSFSHSGPDPEIQRGIAAMITECREITAQILGKESVTAQEYLEWLINRTISQRLPLILEGYHFGSSNWERCAQNNSLLGEKFDVEGAELKHKVLTGDVGEYLSQVSFQWSRFIKGIFELSAVLDGYLRDPISFEALGSAVFNAAHTAMERTNLRSVYESLSGTGRPRYDDFVKSTQGISWELFGDFVLPGTGTTEQEQAYSRAISDHARAADFFRKGESLP